MFCTQLMKALPSPPTAAMRQTRLLRPTTPLVTLALLAAPALAQQNTGPTGQSSSTDRPTTAQTHIEERLPRSPEKPRAPPVSPPPSEPAAPLPSVETLVVSAVTIEGSTVYSSAELATIYEGLLAKAVTIADIGDVTRRITEKYRADGYFLSQAFVPPQGAKHGILRISVVEGYFEDVTFIGAERPEGVALALANRITGERPARLATLERALLLIGDSYGYRVRDAAVETIDQATGRYRLNLDLEREWTQHAVILDNRGTEETGPAQLWTSFGLLLPDSQVQAGVFTVPNQPQELKYVEVQGSKILGPSGTAATLLASTSSSDLGGDDAAFDTESGSGRLSARMSQPLVRSRDLSVWATGVIDIAEYNKEAGGSTVFNDQLRVGRIGANLYATDDLDGTNRLSVELSHGFDMLGASSADGARSRYGAGAEFTKLRVDASRDQALGGNFWIEGQIAGQVSADELLSSEEFSLGGTYIGRGYDYSELTGDHALGGSLELRYGRDVEGPLLRGFQAYGFYDAGVVWNLGEFETDRETLTSAGLGLRLVFEERIRLNLEYAQALTRADDEGNKPRRLFFKLSQGF